MGLVSTPVFLSISLCLSTPWLFQIFRKPRLLQCLLSLALLVHTLYSLHTLLVISPQNIFTELKLPLNTPTDSIRAILLQRTSDTALPPETDRVLTKLKLLEVRRLYVRFGHDVFATCDYCQSLSDYALYGLPRPLLSYVREVAVIGLFTLPTTPLAHLRSIGIGTLIPAGLTEAYWLLTVPVAIYPTDDKFFLRIIMWHDTLLLLRNILFLVLPFLLHLPRIPLIDFFPIISNLVPSPTPTSASPSASIKGTIQTLDHLIPALHLLKYTRAAIMRVPDARERAGVWWDAEREEGDVGRGDDGVRRAAKGMEIGYGEKVVIDGVIEEEEGKLLANTRKAIGSLQESARPSDHWNVPL
ncbi:hypothetical protein K443DRAFT_268614 [Laccaria amethystina LaAM-08-1]|uniref:Uncharacterized protein n=1 Tax=Laccaria amethystina LaAM-08-1 TaxID=1095629 RepID=A0A0C9XH30_9AGAR|nr:hypothetical protein K443DRAFT_268614 [Laccaria amethystina LaAM-08-1]